MTTIKLIPPRGYDTIKPLHDSTGRPVRSNPAPTLDPASTRIYCRLPFGCCPDPDCDGTIDEPQELPR